MNKRNSESSEFEIRLPWVTPSHNCNVVSSKERQTRSSQSITMITYLLLLILFPVVKKQEINVPVFNTIGTMVCMTIQFTYLIINSLHPETRLSQQLSSTLSTQNTSGKIVDHDHIILSAFHSIFIQNLDKKRPN